MGIPRRRVPAYRATATRPLRSSGRCAQPTWREIDWTAAACRDTDPELFFPVGEGEHAQRQIDQAKIVCARCRLTTQCLDWAIASGVTEGVWGGHTEQERRRLRGSHPRSPS